MANLPDINTGSVGFLAYWNAVDNGATSIDPEEVLTDANVQSYTLYDNGVEAVYQINTGRDATLRVKNDGWFVAYFDRTNNFGEETDADLLRGYHDIADNWTSTNNSADFVQHSLERAINSAAQELSNFGSITYNDTDVGLYNYEFTSATTMTGLSQDTEWDCLNDGPGARSANVLYTSGTTLYYFVIYGSSNGGDANPTIDFEGASYVTGDNHGVKDVLNDGDIPSDSTEYTMSLSGSNIGFSPCNPSDSHGGLVSLWA